MHLVSDIDLVSPNKFPCQFRKKGIIYNFFPFLHFCMCVFISLFHFILSLVPVATLKYVHVEGKLSEEIQKIITLHTIVNIDMYLFQ